MYAGQPPKIEGYDIYEANGIKVYLPKNAVTAPEGINILMAGTGPWRGLKIQGLLQ